MTDRDETVDDTRFDDIEALLREVTTADTELTPPPSGLWAQIEAEALGEPSDSAAASLHARVPPTSIGAPSEQPASQPSEPSSETASVHSIEHRRRRWTTPVFVGVAAALMLVVAGFVAISRSADEPSTVVARAQLTYDAATFDELGATAMADAELIEGDDGTAEIKIVDASLPSPGAETADLEVWLIRPDAAGGIADIVSLGLVDPDDPGTFEVPAAYDPAEFNLVDISVEPRDGPPTHSGRSILRGPLVQA